MSHPVCPICGGGLVKNKKAPGRLICRACNQSFNEESILRLWHGTGYSKAVRENFNYPAAETKLGLPVLGGEVDAQELSPMFDVTWDVDPFAEFVAPEDDLSDLQDYNWDYVDAMERAEQEELAAMGKSGPLSILSAIVGLIALIVSLIPVVGLIAVIPALLGMATGRYAWKSLKPGTAYYAAAIFGTIACGLAVIVAIVTVICGNQIIAMLNDMFPSLFSSS